VTDSCHNIISAQRGADELEKIETSSLNSEKFISRVFKEKNLFYLVYDIITPSNHKIHCSILPPGK
jgi:hypothetical protein